MMKTLLALLLVAMGGIAQAAMQLKEGHPQRYTVVEDDTLWDISGKFLRQPWQWPELWQANPQLIYPGDSLDLVHIDGQPRLVLDRAASRGTIKLSPNIRSTPIAEAIPTIPLKAINSFLLSDRIIDDVEQFAAAPYIVAGNAERVVSGSADRIYGRGEFEQGLLTYGIFRQGRTYIDPKTGEFLGINAEDIGTAEIVEVDKDIATLLLTRATQDARIGDRLFPGEERPVNAAFMPRSPEAEIDGRILDVPCGVTQIGPFDVVTLNKGSRDGLSQGHVLAVYRAGETVRDRVSGERVKIPDERAGLLMVFRSYDKLSYGLVLQATRSLAVMDKIRNP